MSFESLFYTDCRQGQGLRGGAGFQFQAVSAGTSHEMMTLVQRSALYEAPLGWMRAKRPVADYPPSLTHVHDGVYATARGVYLGTEMGGVREGNQFTHAVCTVDPQAYGPIRPAQLWGAPWWSEQPAAGTQCDPVPAEPEPGPCGVEAVRDWVLGRPDGESWLVAVNSALERVHHRDARRLVFVGADADEIVRWIAAGTLLLPQETALRIGFRVFATNPQYSRHEVLALHPDWAGQLADTARDDGFVVFNLETGRHSPVEPSGSAQHWVPRFLRADPFDVIDAVELAHRFAREGNRDRPTTADRLVSGVLTFGDPVDNHAHALELADWLVSSSTADALEPVVEAIMSERPSASVLRKLAEAVRTGPVELAVQIRHALLRAQLDEIVRGARNIDLAPLPPLHLPQADQDRALTLVEAAVGSIPPEQVDLLLQLAAGFGLTPRLDRFGAAAARFVSWWADTPGAPISPIRWSCGPQLIDLLRDEFAFRLRGPHAEQTATMIREHWWPLLLPTVTDPFMRLDAIVAGAAVAAGGQNRQDAIGAFRAALRESGRPGTADTVWDALFQHSRPSVTEIVEFLSSAEISDSLAQKVLATLNDSVVDDRYLDVLHALGDQVRTEPLVALRNEDRVLQDWMLAVQRNLDAVPLDDVSAKVLNARAPGVVNVLLAADLPRGKEAVTRGGEALQRMLVRELAVVWNSDSPDQRKDKAVGLAFLIGCSDPVSEAMRTEFDKALEAWATRHKQPAHVRISRLLRAEAASHAAEWHTWLQELGKNKARKPSAARRLFGLRRERGE
ncbi:GTPase-associated protein 1-related protein [Saccharopolyspora taberi]|uniref:Uncharacterized protein n=1 Tax=Saccharopolyspora taberi TaxID=60895 RepID=A0ABN3VHT7_9PSEU